ncbi:hypothetical protein EOPP23_00830 [Endozoicomonas sp. OPT23]|uniref:nucleoside-specific channel-forming Tsx family protein n=1 Tax=Endozoicomonas sp. OPT23 TaxID=2072845 RepID=UPI00129A8E04|nr:outer membrane protein OmpK [Endozoicomonas sp. OPT23]MRI31535.1 hypothetical protein [Endozoicomonas sp. OPT23]
MKLLTKIASAAALTACSFGAMAADYTDGDIHKNDYKWMQFNLMYAFDELPGGAFGSGDHSSNHDYLEMEFGGRSGALDLYGYLDVFNLSNSDSSDKDGFDKMFLKLAPRLSLDAVTGKDLSFGPVKEVYFSTLLNYGGGKSADGDHVENFFYGVGADVEVPWLGKVGMNLYSLYDMNAKKNDGYQFSANWFKPFYFFENGSFLSYQGYVDYQWGVDKIEGVKTDKGGATFHGLYWHSERYALGYGMKLFKDVYALDNNEAFARTTGLGHYIAATYKF